MHRSLILIAIAFVTVSAAAQTADKTFKKCDDAYGNAKYADAVKFCTQAIDAQSDHFEARLTRAAANEKLGNDKAAIEDYSQLIGMTNGMPMIHFTVREFMQSSRKAFRPFRIIRS